MDVFTLTWIATKTCFYSCLFCRLCCDKKLLAQMRGRTLGNSVSRLRSYLVEQHTEAWIRCCTGYLATHSKFVLPGVSKRPSLVVPHMEPVPTRQWLLSVYVVESFSRGFKCLYHHVFNIYLIFQIFFTLQLDSLKYF